LAAKNGNLEMCQIIIKNVEEKSPKTHLGITPSLLAVDFGHDGLAKFLKAYEIDALPQPSKRRRL
jgi:ankyrin repeat protein